MPVVLVQNEQTAGGRYDHWKDAEGVRYHFPNQYKNKIQIGDTFIYYRGVRRRGSRRGTPEYFGVGRIRAVNLDRETENQTKARQHYYADLHEYVPFTRPVPASGSDGPIYEWIYPNQWSVAVRTLSEEQAASILAEAGIGGTSQSEAPLGFTPSPDDVILEHVSDDPPLLRPTGSTGSDTSSSHHPYADKIGADGERLVYEWLMANLPEPCAKTLRWLARERITPGYDLSFHDSSRGEYAVEVKATTASVFSSFEITENEMNAARRMGDRYWLYMVTGAGSLEPKLHKVCNPCRLLDTDRWIAKPTTWRIQSLDRAFLPLSHQ